MSLCQLLSAAVLVCGLAASSEASVITFNSNNGGFSTATLQVEPASGGTPWTYTTGSGCYGGGGCWFVPDYGNVSSQALLSPIFLATGPVVLTFDHSFNEEAVPAIAYDGDVVEISVNGGAFTDAVVKYGPFSGQTYTHTISPTWSNPAGGRAAFSGTNSGGFGVFVTSTMTLSLSSGDHFQLRWVQDTDSASVASSPNGWIVDNVSLDFGAAPVAVPEPGPAGLAAAALAVLALRRAVSRA